MTRQLKKLPDTLWALFIFLISLGVGVVMLDPTRGGKTLVCSDKSCMRV